jgi:GAF domain-containing protein
VAIINSNFSTMENLIISNGSKEEKYKQLIPQIESLLSYESDLYANMANICAALRFTFDLFWVGFYIVKDSATGVDKELVLGPFQGPLACTRIRYGKGVCGTSWRDKRTLIVPDVDKFPGHIACSSLSKSEIVVPIINSKNEVIAILDIDSDKLDQFDLYDQLYLERIVAMITQ